MLTPCKARAQGVILVRLSWTVNAGPAISDIEHREVLGRTTCGAGEHVVEQEGGLRVATGHGLGLVPARVDARAVRPSRLRDGDIGALDQLVQRGRGGRVASVGEDPPVEMQPVAAAVGVAVQEPDRLVAHPGSLPAGLGLTISQPDALAVPGPLVAPGEVEEALQARLDPRRADPGQRA